MRKICFMIIFVVIFFGDCGSEKIERSEKAMGTVLTLKAEGKNSNVAIDECFTKIAALEKNILADTKKIEDAAGNGNFVQIDSEVFENLKIAQNFSELTDGAFDITVGAAVDLWKVARKNSTLPTDEEIFNVQQLVNYKNLELREGDCSARLKVAGMKLTFGGVAKGYAVDICRKIFIKHGINNGMIDFGTSTIFAFGEKNIGLKNPREDSLTEIVKIKNAAISTSGDYENFSIVAGHRINHIINPKTCLPVENKIASVSVIIGDEVENCATTADILSTSVFVIGKERAEEILSNIGFPESMQIAIFIDS